jgi:hypothetical protein
VFGCLIRTGCAGARKRQTILPDSRLDRPSDSVWPEPKLDSRVRAKMGIRSEDCAELVHFVKVAGKTIRFAQQLESANRRSIRANKDRKCAHFCAGISGFWILRAAHVAGIAALRVRADDDVTYAAASLPIDNRVRERVVFTLGRVRRVSDGFQGGIEISKPMRRRTDGHNSE